MGGSNASSLTKSSYNCARQVEHLAKEHMDEVELMHLEQQHKGQGHGREVLWLAKAKKHKVALRVFRQTLTMAASSTARIDDCWISQARRSTILVEVRLGNGQRGPQHVLQPFAHVEIFNKNIE